MFLIVVFTLLFSLEHTDCAKVKKPYSRVPNTYTRVKSNNAEFNDTYDNVNEVNSEVSGWAHNMTIRIRSFEDGNNFEGLKHYYRPGLPEKFLFSEATSNYELKSSLSFANEFCCDCQNTNYYCPVCTYEGKYYCERGGSPGQYSNSMKSWYNNIFLPTYLLLIRYTESYSRNDNYIFKPMMMYYYTSTYPYGNKYDIPYRPTKCDPTLFNSLNAGYSTAFECSSVVLIGESCPTSSIPVVDGCNYNKTVEVPITYSNTYKLCLAPMGRFVALYKFKNSWDGLCTPTGEDLIIPATTSYLRSTISDIQSLLPKVVGFSDGNLILEAVDVNPLEKYLSSHYIDSTFVYAPFKILKTDEINFVLLDDTFTQHGIADMAYYGSLYIRTSTCERYIPYNDTFDICSTPFFNGGFYPPNILFSPVNPPSNYKLPIPHLTLNDKFTCDSLSKLSSCALKDSIYLFQNITLRLIEEQLSTMSGKVIDNNVKLVFSEIVSNQLKSVMLNAVEELIDALGRNDTNVTFKGPKGQVGNWLSGVFGVLIEPFMFALKLLIKTIIPELVPVFIAILDTIVDILKQIVDLLLKLLVSIADSLSEFLTVILRLIIGVITVLESKILLLEYSLLFLLLLYFGLNNVWFALVIVFVFMMVFGVVRRSPSLVLYLLNPEFHIFNLTEYYNKNFSWDYSLAYISENQVNTYYFNNQSIISSSFY